MQRLFLVLFLVSLLFSCNRVKKKGHEAVAGTKEFIKEKEDNLEDKLVGKFDAGTPDTRFNKQRFKEFFHFYPTPDVKNIYCYADQLGIDASYWFAFSCHDSTIQKIRANLLLTRGDVPDEGLGGGLNYQPLSWWDTASINKKLVPWKKEETFIHSYLWYDSTRQKAFFLSYDL